MERNTKRRRVCDGGRPLMGERVTPLTGAGEGVVPALRRFPAPGVPPEVPPAPEKRRYGPRSASVFRPDAQNRGFWPDSGPIRSGTGHRPRRDAPPHARRALAPRRRTRSATRSCPMRTWLPSRGRCRRAPTAAESGRRGLGDVEGARGRRGAADRWPPDPAACPDFTPERPQHYRRAASPRIE